jgi:carbonic anhydrase
VDLTNRWVYKGSVTTPPCATMVYWNVLSTIYPIKQVHIDLFKGQLKRAADDLDVIGNYRMTMPIDK